MADYSNLFNLDTNGNFSVLESIQSYHNNLIYVKAENIFGITGGSDHYLIDLSYKVIPQFIPDFSKIVVLLSETSIIRQIYTFKLSSDVTLITIKNAVNFPYMAVSMNAIIIDKS